MTRQTSAAAPFAVAVNRRAVLAACVAAGLSASAFARSTFAQSTRPAESAGRPMLPFGTAAFNIPPATKRIVVTDDQIRLLDVAIDAASGSERVRLIAEVGHCGTAGVPLLKKHASDADPLVRSEIARAIAAIADASAKDLLTPLMADGEAGVRREAVIAAGVLGRSDLVLMAINDPDASVRRAAFLHASTADHARRIAEGLATLPGGLKADAVRALARIDAATYVNEFAAALNGDTATRAAAVAALGQSGVKAQANAVKGMLADPSPTVRRAALSAWGRLATPPETQTAAVAGLNDPDAGVRTAAAELLREHPTVEALSKLQTLLDERDRPLHQSVLLAMAAIGEPIVPVAQALLTDASPARRRDGSFLLGRLKSRAGLDQHVLLLDSKVPELAGQAAESLALIGAPAELVGPHIAALLRRVTNITNADSSHIDAAASAIRLAGQAGYTDILPALRPLVSADPGQTITPEPLRLSAIWAIGLLASPASEAADAIRAVPDSMYQTNRATFESIKARVNMNDRSLLSLADSWDTDVRVSSDICRWMAHRASDHFHGRATPFTVAQREVRPVLAVSPLEEGSTR